MDSVEENGRGGLRRQRRVSTKLANYVDPPTDDEEDGGSNKRKGKRGVYGPRKKTPKEDEEKQKNEIDEANGVAGLVKEKRAATKIVKGKDLITEASGSKPMVAKGKRTKKEDEIDGEIPTKPGKKPKTTVDERIIGYRPVSDFSVNFVLSSYFTNVLIWGCIYIYRTICATNVKRAIGLLNGVRPAIASVIVTLA